MTETMLWKEKEISGIMAVQMENLRSLLSIRKMDRVARIREFCRVKKEVDERIAKSQCGLSQLYGACGWKSVCGQTYNLKGMKGKIYLFSFLSFDSLLL